MTPEQWQQLFTTLGDAGSRLYAAAARQAQLDAFLSALVTILLVVVMAWTVKTAIELHKGATLNNENDLFAVLLCVLFPVLACFAYVFAYEAISYLLNPQWAVYETIASLMQ